MTTIVGDVVGQVPSVNERGSTHDSSTGSSAHQPGVPRRIVDPSFFVLCALFLCCLFSFCWCFLFSSHSRLCPVFSMLYFIFCYYYCCCCCRLFVFRFVSFRSRKTRRSLGLALVVGLHVCPLTGRYPCQIDCALFKLILLSPV